MSVDAEGTRLTADRETLKMNLKMTFNSKAASVKQDADMTSISKIRPGTKARVRSVGGGGPIRQRLLDMGILPRAVIEVTRHAPAGGPIWIRVGPTQLSLRRSEATSVIVSAVDE